MDNTEEDKARKKRGNQLKERREKLGLTQAQLAVKAKINANFYARVERGEANLAYVKMDRVLKVLGIESSLDMPNQSD